MSAPPPAVIRALKLFRRFGLARGLLQAAKPRPPGLPPRPLELYALEGCGHCRRVREALTELDLDYLNLSCPMGSERNRAPLRERGGKVQLPFLIDPNTGVAMYESRAIVAYLEETYGGGDASRAAR